MPANKRQHFVPKHILRRFSTDEFSRQIDLFNKNSNKTIRGASLKEQCYKDYWHGTDPTIEKQISDLEAADSRLIDDIIARKSLRHLTPARLSILICLQRSRTLTSGRQFDDMTDLLAKMTLNGRIDEDKLRSIEIISKNGINMAIAQSLISSPIIIDLRYILVENRSTTPFIMSDHPVSFTNWFARDRFSDSSGVGLSCSGLQIYFPISPNLAILAFDRNVYSLLSDEGSYYLRRSGDVDRLNLVQLSEAQHNIYFNENFRDEMLLGILARLPVVSKNMKFQRMEERGEKDRFVLTDKDQYAPPSEDIESELIMMGPPKPAVDIRVPGLRLKSDRKLQDVIIGGRASVIAPPRDRAWVEIVRSFGDAVHRKEIMFEDFPEYASRHPHLAHVGPWLRVSLRKYGTIDDFLK